MERSYSGMNSAYYVGMESAFYCPPEKFTSSDLKEYLSGDCLCFLVVQLPFSQSPTPHVAALRVRVCQQLLTVSSGFDTSPTSGSSSNTATQMTVMDLPEDVVQEMPVEQAQEAISAVMDRPLPIRKRQRKPMKKTRAELEAESAPVVARRKPGRKPKATSGMLFFAFAPEKAHCTSAPLHESYQVTEANQPEVKLFAPIVITSSLLFLDTPLLAGVLFTTGLQLL